jgi:serine/threonine protein kinase
VLEAVYNGAQVAVKKSAVASVDESAITKERALFGAIPHHPNVVHVLGVCEDTPDGLLWIVMEYAALGSVQAYLRVLTEGGKASGVERMCFLLSCAVM